MRHLAILLTLVPSLAWAQGGPLQQGGAITPGHVARFVTNGVVGDGGSAQNGTVTEIGINNSGTPFCIADAPTTGPYHQLCLGANSLGNGIVSYQAYNGAPVQSLMCNINGVIEPCILSASNVQNLPGPLNVAGLLNTQSLGVFGTVEAGNTVYANGGMVVSGVIPSTNVTASISGLLNTQNLGVFQNANIDGNVTADGVVHGGSLISNGDLSVGGDAWANSWNLNSDAKLKSDIEDFKPHGVDAVKKLRPVSFRFGAGLIHYGLIADEVERVVPQAVRDHNGVKTIDVMALIDVLITANRELADRVEALEKRLPAAH